ncbi:MAG TPA: protein adenylyltransferase SelO family protein, partial [Mycoplana sp.]|nr:protein adenylyltransferase SelO family protein [Mycoplana sp.]
RYLKLIDAVAERQARLIARWLGVGFIHGVMNTDNMAISGETIDFGPCAFMDTYDPRTVFSSIDQMGRYAYGNQPMIGQWNIARLAETLLPLIHETPDEAVDLANDAVSRFMERFQAQWKAVIRAKLGLGELEEDEDTDLIRALLALMHEQKADFTLSFRRLSNAAADENADPTFAALLADPQAVAPWLSRWRQRLSRDGRPADARAAAMRAVNPAFIPRNHRVEEALKAASEDQDFSLFEALNDVLARPYEDQPDFTPYTAPPKPGEEVLQTFCGT